MHEHSLQHAGVIVYDLVADQAFMIRFQLLLGNECIQVGHIFVP